MHFQPTFNIDYAKKSRPNLFYDWNGHVDLTQDGLSLSDYEVAGMVRMLMRDNLRHEAVCVMARDRIMALSKEVARLEAVVSSMAPKTPEMAEEAHEAACRPDINQLMKLWDKLDGATARVSMSMPSQMSASIEALDAARMTFRAAFQEYVIHTIADV